MSKTVTFIADVYPYVVGDVMVLNEDELKAVDKVAKVRKMKVYEDYSPTSESAADISDSDKEPSMAELREKAKELEVSAAGSKKDLMERIATAEAEVKAGEESEE